MKRTIALLFTVPALLLCAADAGTKFMVECQNTKCGYTAEIVFGGRTEVDFARPGGGLSAGGSFGPLTGFCGPCKQFVSGMVYLGYFPGWKKEDDRYICQVWDPALGKGRILFRCPKCEKPVIAVLDVAEMTHCPRCEGSAACRRADQKGQNAVPNMHLQPTPR